MDRYDIAVIGSGPAGHAVAIQAAKLGKRTAVIEKSAAIGGASVNLGTIPSKAFRESVVSLTGFWQRDLGGPGASARDGFTVRELSARSEQVVSNENRVVRDQFVRNGVDLIAGQACLADSHRISIRDGEQELSLEADSIFIATGSTPARSDKVAINGRTIIDSDGLHDLTAIPRTMIVVGGGVVGVEYASTFAALGTRVTVVDQRRRILNHLDQEIMEALGYHLRQHGVTFRLGEEVTLVQEEGGKVVAHTASNKRIVGEVLLYAAGRQGVSQSLGLEHVGVEPDDRGRIPVNECYQTAVPHIYAVGDVIGFPALAGTSMIQGRCAVMHALGLAGGTPSAPLPYGMYSIPEVSMVGRTEEELTQNATPYESGIARYRETARGQIIGDRNGLMKLLIHAETREVLGIHIIGEGATELVHLGQMVMALGGTVDTLADNPFNYPTLAECYRVAALDAFNKLGCGSSDRDQAPAEPVSLEAVRSRLSA